MRKLPILAILPLLLVLACNDHDHDSTPTTLPTGPLCPEVGGNYRGAFSNSCGTTLNQDVTVVQPNFSRCDFAFSFGPNDDSITGTTADGNTATFSVQFAYPCSGTATGTATVTSSSIVGTYSGRSIGCCDPVSGTFTLTR